MLNYTPTTFLTNEIVIKKSKFIGSCNSVHSADEAISFIKQESSIEASHNCWAYKIGDNYRFSDDGEPSGTAGKPIYNSIENNNCDQIVILITRFFGGTKLGAGGLIRAYSQCATDLLKDENLQKIEKKIELCFQTDFSYSSTIFNYFNKNRIKEINQKYISDGAIFTVILPEENSQNHINNLIELTSGSIIFSKLPSL